MAAEEGILESKSAIGIPWLMEAHEANISGVDEGCLVLLVDILPVSSTFNVLLVVILPSHPFRHACDAKVVVRIIDSPGYRVSEGANAIRIEVVCWHIDFQEARPPRPSTAQLGGSSPAFEIMASYPRSQSMFSVTFFKYESTRTTSAFEPP